MLSRWEHQLAELRQRRESIQAHVITQEVVNSDLKRHATDARQVLQLLIVSLYLANPFLMPFS